MCINSCLAFTGLCEPLNVCSHCRELWYCSETTKPQKCFTTIPTGPVLQAMYKLSGHCKHDLEMKFTDNVEHA